MVDRADRQPLGATTSTTAIAPAPALLANGWNDDLFPVDESLRYYNKVRAKYPNTPISMFHLDFGHNPRAGAISRRRPRGARRRRERLDGLLRQGRRLRARRRARRRRHPHLQVPGQRRRHALPRADLGAARARRGPARHDRARRRSPRPAPRRRTRSPPATSARRPRSADNASRRDLQGPGGDAAPTRSRARRRSSPSSPPPAPTTWSPRGCTTSTARPQRLIARGVQRPLGVGAGPTQQVFQLHPQAWTVAARPRAQARAARPGLAVPAHADAAAPQQSVTVTDLQLRLPVVDAPGTDLGNGVTVATPAAKVVPAGYKLARELRDRRGRRRRRHGARHARRSRWARRRASARSRRASAREYTAQHDRERDLHGRRRDAERRATPVHLTNGAFALAAAAAASRSRRATWSGPVVQRAGDDHVPAGDRRERTPLRTGDLREDADLHAVDDESLAKRSTPHASSVRKARLSTSTTSEADVHSQVGTPALRSRCSTVRVFSSGRVTCARAGTSGTGMAESAGS